jgi:argininosuccinate synthase
MKQTIVLAYSGGLDTSVLLKRFVLEGHDVIALTADLGESDAVAGAGAADVLDQVKKKAISLGARDAILVDAKARFIEGYAFKALQANALYQAVYPLSAALSRPLIAALLVETAHAFGAQAVAHGCTGKGNDQVRIDLGVRALDPALVCRAPLREQPLSRPAAIAYAAQHGVPVPHSAERPYSIDANLWGRSIEAGVLEDPWNAPPEDAYAWTASPALRPKTPDEIDLEFDEGYPSWEGRTGCELVAALNALAGKHGVGRIDMVEDRVVGLKSREVYECPASSVLIAAHQAMERVVLTRDELRFKTFVDCRYAEIVYDGLWYSPLRDALDAFAASGARRVTGRVRVRLYQGSATITGLQSPLGLYSQALATYGEGDLFDHRAAEGFIKLHGLPLEMLARAAATPTLPV